MLTDPMFLMLDCLLLERAALAKTGEVAVLDMPKEVPISHYIKFAGNNGWLKRSALTHDQ
jgi:hypothetical protein